MGSSLKSLRGNNEETKSRTLTTKANEYHAYLKEAGIKKILATLGNLGAQLLRRTA